jgi:preprotein translocase subunit SecG
MYYAQANYSDRFKLGMLATIMLIQLLRMIILINYNIIIIILLQQTRMIGLRIHGIPQTKPIEWRDSVLSRTSYTYLS